MAKTIFNKNSTYFTSESVCSGHPDKICDQISEAILDEVLGQDKYGKVAVEALVTENKIIVAGEISANATVDYKKVIRRLVLKLGYTEEILKFTYKSPIELLVHHQSPEIAIGVAKKGAGDQGMMFGYACLDTDGLMPLAITIAHMLCRKVDEVRDQKILPYLRPDGKSQVTVEYKNGKPCGIKSVVLAVPHTEKVTLDEVKEDLYRLVVIPTLEKFNFKIKKADLVVNGTGVWHFSGPAADTGLTGRKIICDSYGAFARVGGGAFSGKDPTKVDRSGAYAARFLAKNIVAQKLAGTAEVSLAYYIGAKTPLMKSIETFGTEKVSAKTIRDFVDRILDCSVEGILDGLELRQPIYLPTAAYGHFGRSEFPWERLV